MVIALCMVVAFTMTGSAVLDLHVSQNVLDYQRAKALAENAVAQALDSVMGAADKGTLASFGTPTFQTTTTSPPTLSFLTFASSNSYGFPASTLNTSQTQPTHDAFNNSIPPTSCELVGTGHCGAATVTVESLVSMPMYPYVVGVSSQFNALGSTTIARVNSLSNVSPSNYLPADVGSNSAASPAITLGAGSLVTGDVDAVGSVNLAPGG